MSRLMGCMGVLWLLAGCTVPSLEDLLKDKARECNTEHPCDKGYLCIQQACVTSPCGDSVTTVGYRDEDSDGYAGLNAAYVIFCGSMPDGYASQSGDCNDSDTSIKPGASELCDGRDNDCDGTSDQGVGSPWYYDRDRDGFGDPDTAPLLSCTRPADTSTTRYVETATDCNDSNPAVYPRNDVSEARCDEVDDDCDGKVDEGFEAKGAACSDPCPGGQYACNASHTGLSCNNAPAPMLYYPDVDGDGAGDDKSTPVQVCPGATPPTGAIANTDDCADQDKYNRRGIAESCDDRDNNCDTQRDEGNVCGGKGWNVVADGALIGTSHQWKTVAIGSGGLPVWVAGDNGALAVRTAAGQPFKSLDGACGNYDWRAAWVRPNGHVLLAGEGGRLAEYDGINACSNQTTTTSGDSLTGMVEFNSPNSQVYIVGSLGRMYAWTPGYQPEERYNETSTYFGIHGLAPTQLLAVGGQSEANSAPYIASYPGSGNQGSVVRHTLNGASGFTGVLRAVWMGDSRLAYSVGDNGLVMKWDGATNWTRVSPPPDNTTAPFSSVVVLDPSSIYVTDASTNGSIRRLNAAGTWFTATTVNRPLRDIALSSPGDIWAVGDDGRVVHFPE
ncbi:hypothetical protein JRI60_52555 [Archangium violaceum]|uniref:MopE-related protein n=1 Tax=Archangium violaceum TaxID=83451 RepID=UPI00194E9D8E|nr:MopE-related protein [Archangium violaceum]QRN97469.1 hypothetical protein JRI60_52555 [Archangium violaceum]